MATKIVTKNSSTASAVPTASDLVQGELAVNVADKRLFTEDNAGAIVELGTNPTTLNVNGTATMDGLTVEGNALVQPASGSAKLTLQTSNTTSDSQLIFGDSASNNIGGVKYSHSDDNMRFETAATERMRIDSSGNLLVGTTDDVVWNNSANSAADNGHNLRDDGRAGFAYYNATANSNATVNINRTGSDGDLIRLFKSGTNVGSIGTVSGDIRIGGPDDNHAAIRFAASSKAVLPVKNSDGDLSDNTTDLGASSARFKDLYLSGNALVGRSSSLSGQSGSVSANTVVSAHGPLSSHATNAGILEYYNDETLLRSYGANAGSGKLVFKVGGGGGSTDSEAMRIDSSGNLALMTDGADIKLYYTEPRTFITNSGASVTIKQIDNNTTNAFIDFASWTNSSLMRLMNSGSLLVGATSPASGFKLQVDGGAGNGRYTNINTGGSTFDIFRFNGGAVGSITTNGVTTSFNTSSDARLKENIADADDAGNKIDAIQVRKFDWKADGSHQDYGMIAQELQAVAPEAVSVPQDSEEMMGVDYSKLVPMLVKEIQSLRNRVAQLEE